MYTCKRLGPDIRYCDLPAPERSSKVPVDGRQYAVNFGSSNTRHRSSIVVSWRAASRRLEDGRGDPAAAGDRKDPHAPGIAGAGTDGCASPRPGAASGLTLPPTHCSGGPAPRAAGIGCARTSQDHGNRRKRRGRPDIHASGTRPRPGYRHPTGDGRPQRSHSASRRTVLATQWPPQRHEKSGFERPILAKFARPREQF